MGGVNLSCVRLLRVLEFENLLFGLGIYHLYKNYVQITQKRNTKKQKIARGFARLTFTPTKIRYFKVIYAFALNVVTYVNSHHFKPKILHT